MTFGERLREARMQRGLTQGELGGRKYSASYVSLLERGHRQPSIPMTEHFAGLLGVEAEEVAGWIDSTVIEQGTLTVSLLNAISAWNARDPALARSEAEYAAGLASEVGNLPVLWNMSLMKVDAAIATEQIEEAETALEALLISAGTDGEPELLATTLLRMSAVQRSKGDLDKAIAFGRRAVAAASNLPERAATRLEASFALAAALSVRGQTEEAWSTASRLMQMTRTPDIPSILVGKAAWVIGNIAFRRGDTATGLAQYAVAAEHINPRTDVTAWARFHRASASHRLNAGMADSAALRSIENAELGFRIVGSDAEHVELTLTKAHYHCVKGEFTEAAGYLFEVSKQSESLEFELGGLLDRLFGRYYAYQGDVEKARLHYMRAAKIYSDAGASEIASTILDELIGLVSDPSSTR